MQEEEEEDPKPKRGRGRGRGRPGTKNTAAAPVAAKSSRNTRNSRRVIDSEDEVEDVVYEDSSSGFNEKAANKRKSGRNLRSKAQDIEVLDKRNKKKTKIESNQVIESNNDI
mmetsp:Transcript_8610/g.1158  ORF Transcript_8610/g.1158 Transcript_8610/m.1158 type:complete len:112 (+) Transcript_8610:106-441(+)